MNILIALSRFPYPTDKGDKLRAFYQIKELARRHSIFLVCLTDTAVTDEQIKALEVYCKKIDIIYQDKKRIFNNLFQSLFNSKPFQVNYFTNEDMKVRIREMIQVHQIDLVYVQLVRLVDNMPFDANIPFFLDYMDALSAGMFKRIRFSSFYEKPLVWIEARRLKKFEIKAGAFFQGYSIITDQDATYLPAEIRAKMQIVPNGVNKYYLEPIKKIPKKYDIIFTGNMGYHPNIVAAKFIVERIIPILKLKGWNLKVCLAGTNPSSSVQKLKSENVEVTGFVEDIRDYLYSSRVFVAPLFSGSGLQNKLLEAMACGIPTITTTLANDALGGKDSEDILISNTAEIFAAKIEFLLQNELLAEEIGMKGREYIEQQFDWTTTTVKLENEFQHLVNEKISI